MVCQHKRWRRPPHRLVPLIGDGVTADKIGPAVPRALMYLKQHVRRVPYGTTPPVVRALIGGEQPTIRQEAEAVGVPQPPGNQLQVGPVGVAAHYPCTAGQLGWDVLSRLGR